MLKGALLGFGKVAEAAHVPAFLARPSDFRITAVADERDDRLARAAQMLPGVRTYKRAEELLAKEELDFADIATPPGSHARLAQAALGKKLHALVEKPLTLNLKDLASLKAMAASQQRSLFTVNNWRYAPQYLKLKELVASGTLGQIRHAELHTLRAQPAATVAAPGLGPATVAADNWRLTSEAGGILVDHGWHAFYLLRHLTGQEPKSVACRAKGEGEATLLIQLAEGSGIIHLTWNAPYRSNWALLVGTRGTAELRDDQVLLRTAAASQSFDFPQKISAGSAHPDWFETMLPEFLAETTDPSRRGLNLDEAEVCLRLVLQAQQSQRMGGDSAPLPQTVATA